MRKPWSVDKAGVDDKARRREEGGRVGTGKKSAQLKLKTSCRQQGGYIVLQMIPNSEGRATAVTTPAYVIPLQPPDFLRVSTVHPPRVPVPHCHGYRL